MALGPEDSLIWPRPNNGPDGLTDVYSYVVAGHWLHIITAASWLRLRSTKIQGVNRPEVDNETWESWGMTLKVPYTTLKDYL